MKDVFNKETVFIAREIDPYVADFEST